MFKVLTLNTDEEIEEACLLLYGNRDCLAAKMLKQSDYKVIQIKEEGKHYICVSAPAGGVNVTLEELRNERKASQKNS